MNAGLVSRDTASSIYVCMHVCMLFTQPANGCLTPMTLPAVLDPLMHCTADPLNSGLSQLTRFGAGTACDTPCAGDARMVCGGQQQASVYLENSAVPAVPPNDYTSVGCFK